MKHRAPTGGAPRCLTTRARVPLHKTQRQELPHVAGVVVVYTFGPWICLKHVPYPESDPNVYTTTLSINEPGPPSPRSHRMARSIGIMAGLIEAITSGKVLKGTWLCIAKCPGFGEASLLHYLKDWTFTALQKALEGGGELLQEEVSHWWHRTFQVRQRWRACREGRVQAR